MKLAIPLFVAAALLISCGDDNRRGGGITRRGDSGPQTFPDATALPERDGGTQIHPDATQPPPHDSGITPPPPDGGMMMMEDSGVTEPQALTIYELQNEASANHPALDAMVRISGAVTAVYVGGQNLGSFWVQDPSGGPFSGVFVYVPLELQGRWSVVEGDRVTVLGRFHEYFDLTEVVIADLEAQTPGTPLAPELRAAADLADLGSLAEAYEGVLVRVEFVTVTSSNPDAPMDHGEFEVTGGLRVDDAIYRLDPRPLPGAIVDSITGVMNYAFEHRKLLPRTVFDIGLIH